MDARINDAPLSNVQQLEVVEERSSAAYNLDVDALNRLIEFGREHNPRFRGASEARIAEICEVSETTLKSIRKGRNKKPRVDILYSIVAPFGGSLDRLIGLAPKRDIARESAVWDGTLVDGYQQRVAALEKQISVNEAELSRLRLRVLDESNGRKAAETRVEQLTELCNSRREDMDTQYQRYQASMQEAYKRQHNSRRMNIILSALIIAILIAYIIFEIVYIDYGITGVIRRALKII